MLKVYRTKKGTDLPILNLRGKDYLEVKYRIVWMREEHADWGIETEFINIKENSCLTKAVIRDASGAVLATSHKFEDRKGFPDFVEKSETGAIGRALALLGYGTQFCADELDEGTRIVDGPVEPKASAAQSKPVQASATKPVAKAAAAPVVEKPAVAVVKTNTAETPLNRARIIAAARKNDWANEDVSAFIAEHFKKSSSRDLSDEQCVQLIQIIESHEPREALLFVKA